MIKVSVYHRTDDKDHPWWINYRLPTGRRIRVPASHRKDLAKLIALETQRELNAGNFDPQIMIVADFFSEFMADLENRSPKTVFGYKRTLRLFEEMFGETRLVDVVPAHIQEFLLKLAPLAAATKARYLRELSAAFNTAVTWGYIPRNPCKGVRRPRTPRNPPRMLEKAELLSLLKLAEGTPLHAMLATAAYAGLRSAELIWLEWKDVDLKRDQIYVRNKPGHPLKNYEARTVPIPERLVNILEALPR